MRSFLLVDDQPSVRQALRMQIELEPGQTVVGEAGTASLALALAQRLQPDVVIMDVALPDGDGISVMTEVRCLAPRCAVLILTMHGDEQTRTRAMQAGADAFAEKGTAEAFGSALREVVHSCTLLRCDEKALNMKGR